MHLVDTNIFLEILLDQDRRERCKRFLQEELENLHLSDFSLHSIGVILLRRREGELLRRFLEDTLPNLTLVGLPRERYSLVVDFAEQLNLDFDDAYQCAVAQTRGLSIVTFDQDFKKAMARLPVNFLGIPRA